MDWVTNKNDVEEKQVNMKENNKKSVILNLIQDLRRLSLQLINNLRGRFQIKFEMTPCGAPEIKEGYPSSFLVNGESCSLNNTNVSCTYKNILYQLYYRHIRHAHAGLIRCVVLAYPKQAPLETDICRRETGRTKASETVNGGTRWNY